MSPEIDPPSTVDEWSVAAVEYFSNAFPNPARDGCPDPERLGQAAESIGLVTGDIRTHLFQCSECFKAFRAARPSAAPSEHGTAPATAAGSRVRAMAATAAAIVAFVGVGLLLSSTWNRRMTTTFDTRSTNLLTPGGNSASREPSGSHDLPTVVRVQVLTGAVRRGTAESTQSSAAPIAIPPEPIRFEIALPDGYPDGEYRVAIVTPFDDVLVEARVDSAGRIVAALVDAGRVQSGRGFLRIEHGGQPPDYVPIVVEQRR